MISAPAHQTHPSGGDDEIYTPGRAPNHYGARALTRQQLLLSLMWAALIRMVYEVDSPKQPTEQVENDTCHRGIVLCAVVSVVHVHAAEVSLSGTVTDSDGAPVADARPVGIAFRLDAQRSHSAGIFCGGCDSWPWRHASYRASYALGSYNESDIAIVF